MEQAQVSPILVTGGTGTLGRLVIPLLQDAGYDVRVLSRRVTRRQRALSSRRATWPRMRESKRR